VAAAWSAPGVMLTADRGALSLRKRFHGLALKLIVQAGTTVLHRKTLTFTAPTKKASNKKRALAHPKPRSRDSGDYRLARGTH
jgi:predicted Rossmann-fold nucleotide-binding protein